MQIDLVDSGGRNIRRLGGDALQKGVQHLLVDGSDSHQVVAQTAAVAGLTLQRLGTSETVTRFA